MKRKVCFFNKNGNLPTPFADSVVAVSVRLVEDTYTGDCLQVRRDSDDAVQDIGFVDGELDTTSLLSFVGANSGYVTKWYNQGLQGGSFDQATTTAQPRIVNAGTLVTDGGTVAVDFIDDTRYLDSTFANGGWSTEYSFYCVGRGVNGTAMMRSPTASGYQIFWFYFNRPAFRNAGTQLTLTDTAPTNVRKLWSAFDVSDNLSAYINDTFIESGALNGNWSSTIFLRLFQRTLLQELIIFPDDRTSSNTEIVSNINSYYSIF